MAEHRGVDFPVHKKLVARAKGLRSAVSREGQRLADAAEWERAAAHSRAFRLIDSAVMELAGEKSLAPVDRLDAERDRDALRDLARAMYRNGDFFDFNDLEGADQQRTMATAGLIERVTYDPDIHGEGIEADPGDPIYVLSEYGREILGEES